MQKLYIIILNHTLAKRSETGLPSNQSKCLELHSPHNSPPSPNSPQLQVPRKTIFKYIIKMKKAKNKG